MSVIVASSDDNDSDSSEEGQTENCVTICVVRRFVKQCLIVLLVDCMVTQE